jgi:single-stranded-DNA-specific exonuclease
VSQSDRPWQIESPVEVPDRFLDAVRKYVPGCSGRYAAQLLWQRGIRDLPALAQFLDPKQYAPSDPFAFGEEMHRAIDRLQLARERGEKVAIWGDFDADGVTATSVLWDGLGQFFDRPSQLSYYIPNRLSESHGLNEAGIERLARSGVTLIVTCDTGSTNLAEIERGNERGIDTIVTDHHTLLPDRPPVVALINPRSLPADSPLATLSGVAVAYKLVEALYLTLPEVPQDSLETLLDLVAIGLIADLVELRGDCRYLAQVGIERLHREYKKPEGDRHRPGIGYLLDLCNRNGDRPTDISFGIGPRINAVSRIRGDASFCVELLTSRDRQRTRELAEETELANTRRKQLQQDTLKQVSKRLERVDLSTTTAIAIADEQWPAGVLGLVAGQVAQEYGKPTILLRVDPDRGDRAVRFARGSARSVDRIDLYELVRKQAHLLHRFGGHPYAAGLSLAVENFPLFQEGIDRELREQFGKNEAIAASGIPVDLICTVAELGKDLFQELRLLEPCGMGNPVPQLLIENCWFKHVWNKNIKDLKGNKIKYIKTEFKICDETAPQGFPGLWWGHYKEEIPETRCDAIVELDFNAYKKEYQVRIVALRAARAGSSGGATTRNLKILDWRDRPQGERDAQGDRAVVLRECPKSWDEVQFWCHEAWRSGRPLAIAYDPPDLLDAIEVWTEAIDRAEDLSRTGERVGRKDLCEILGIGDRTIDLYLEALRHLGFEIVSQHPQVQLRRSLRPISDAVGDLERTRARFLAAVREEQFHRQYFYSVSVATLQAHGAAIVASAEEGLETNL